MQKFEASAIMFFEEEQKSRREKEMSSGEQSSHNLFEFFFHQQRVAAWKTVQMAFQGFSCLMWRRKIRENEERKAWEKRLRILIPNFLFSGTKKQEKKRRKMKWKQKREIIILLAARLFWACENIIPLRFECSMCLLCFSHLKAAAAMDTQARRIFCSTQRNVIYFLGKMKMSVRARDIRRFVLLVFCFRLWFAFYFTLFYFFPPSYDDDGEGIKALSR